MVRRMPKTSCRKPTSGRLVLDQYGAKPREVAVGDLGEIDRFSLYELIEQEDPFPYSDSLHRDFLAQLANDDVRRALLRLPEVYRVPGAPVRRGSQLSRAGRAAELSGRDHHVAPASRPEDPGTRAVGVRQAARDREGVRAWNG